MDNRVPRFIYEVLIYVAFIPLVFTVQNAPYILSSYK
jgi:hypothetical protein